MRGNRLHLLQGQQRQHCLVSTVLLPAVTGSQPLLVGDTLTVAVPKTVYRFASLGAAPLSVELNDYHILPKSNRNIVLGRPGTRLLSYELVTGKDTLALDRVKFNADSSMLRSRNEISFTATIKNLRIVITYAFAPEGYLANVRGSLTGTDSTTELLIRLHEGLPFVESDSE